MCFIGWRSWGASDRTKGREKEEVGGQAWDRQLWPSHLGVRFSDSSGAGKPFHQSRKEGKEYPLMIKWTTEQRSQFNPSKH